MCLASFFLLSIKSANLWPARKNYLCVQKNFIIQFLAFHWRNLTCVYFRVRLNFRLWIDFDINFLNSIWLESTLNCTFHCGRERIFFTEKNIRLQRDFYFDAIYPPNNPKYWEIKFHFFFRGGFLSFRFNWANAKLRRNWEIYISLGRY